MTYLPVNGRLISFDAEDAQAGGGWRFETRYDGYLGDGYLRWIGGNQYNGPTGNILRYEFEAPQAGAYYLTARARRDYDGQTIRKDEANDFYVRFDNGPWTKFLFSGATDFGQWVWAQTFDVKHQAGPAMAMLTKGDHVLEIAGRSTAAALDRIYINLDARSLNANAPLSPVEGTPGNPDPTPDPDPVASDLVIRAGGNGTAGDPPRFEVIVDGVSIGTRSISAPLSGPGFNVNNDANYQNYAFDLASAAPRKIEIVYLNDGVTGGVNRNLFVDYIDVNGVRFEAEDKALFVPKNPASNLGGARESAFVNGTFVFQTDGAQPPSDGTQVVVRAGGTGSAGAAPAFEVIVDGVSQGVRTVSDPVATGFNTSNDALFDSFVFDVASRPDTVEIVFLNDGKSNGVDRNLFVDFIEIGGRRVEAEQGATFVPDNPSSSLGGARESAFVNGRFVFDDLLAFV